MLIPHMNNRDVENTENLDTRMYSYTYYEATCRHVCYVYLCVKISSSFECRLINHLGDALKNHNWNFVDILFMGRSFYLQILLK